MERYRRACGAPSNCHADLGIQGAVDMDIPRSPMSACHAQELSAVPDVQDVSRCGHALLLSLPGGRGLRVDRVEQEGGLFLFHI